MPMQLGRPRCAYSGFSIQQPLPNQPALDVIGETQNAPARDPLWHAHGFHEFVCVVRGTSSLQIEGQTLMVKAGQVTVTYPGEFHAVNGAAERNTHFLWVRLALDKFGPAGAELEEKLRRNQVRLLHGAFDLEPALRGLLRQAVRREAHFEQVMHTQVQMIVALLIQRVGAIQGPILAALPTIRVRRLAGDVSSNARLPEVRGAFSAEVGVAMEYMRTILDRPILMKEVAAHSPISASHLYHRFRKEVGASPHACHLEMRLNAAKDALTNPDLSIVTVAQMFGFSSGQHFSTAFAKMFGVSPRAWRRQNGALPEA